MSLADPRVLVPRAERWDDVFSFCLARCLYFEGGVEGGGGRLVVWLCSEYVCQQLFGILLLLMVLVLAEELSPAMASSIVWGFAGARFDLLLLPLCKVK